MSEEKTETTTTETTEVSVPEHEVTREEHRVSGPVPVAEETTVTTETVVKGEE